MTKQSSGAKRLYKCKYCKAEFLYKWERDEHLIFEREEGRALFREAKEEFGGGDTLK